ncbi:MAG: hypothetical protein NTZ21_12490 [Actinobacteria bacterium]|nr:hypothetical protein [Actinomycetota bacterium]
MHAPERLDGLRVVATPDALDHAWFEGDVVVFRIAHDEVIAFGAVVAEVPDEHAIVERETAFVGWGLSYPEFDDLVARHVEWPLPTERPALAQGMAAGLPVKLWFEHDRVLLVVSSGFAHEVVERFRLPAFAESVKKQDTRRMRA